MIIPNGKLTRIDAPAPATAGGDESWVTGPAVAYDVTIDNPTRQQRWSLGATIAEATAVIYLPMDEVGYGVDVPAGTRVLANLVLPDGQSLPAQTFRVIHRIQRVHDELSHFELFVKEVA